MTAPRSAGELGESFPYTLTTMCYIEIDRDGAISWGVGIDAYERTKKGESRLYAVWPGQWSSQLFVIDDLDQYAGAFGIIHDEKRTGLADHEHQVRWELSPFERKPNGSYITVDVWFDCGCVFRDINTFASHMRQQRGWDVATTGGWGSSGDRHHVRVRRTSLKR
jgi:hypothetical protein